MLYMLRGKLQTRFKTKLPLLLEPRQVMLKVCCAFLLLDYCLDFGTAIEYIVFRNFMAFRVNLEGLREGEKSIRIFRL